MIWFLYDTDFDTASDEEGDFEVVMIVGHS